MTKATQRFSIHSGYTLEYMQFWTDCCSITVRSEFKLQELVSKLSMMTHVVTKIKIVVRHFNLTQYKDVIAMRYNLYSKPNMILHINSILYTSIPMNME